MLEVNILVKHRQKYLKDRFKYVNLYSKYIYYFNFDGALFLKVMISRTLDTPSLISIGKKKLIGEIKVLREITFN